MQHGRGVAREGPAAQPAAEGHSWLARLLGPLRRGRVRLEAAHLLYLALVDQARRPEFYADWGVPDSRDGRLELVYVHAALVMRRLRREGSAGQELAQALFDLMFRDLDRHLREWGVGDQSVGKQVKRLAQSFYGRAVALDRVIAAVDRTGLQDVLRRNVYAEVAEPPRVAVARLGDYLLAQERWLATLDGAALLSGAVTFSPPGPGDRA
jgi:cytochrome b pre-mRNA-processing protein 3